MTPSEVSPTREQVPTQEQCFWVLPPVPRPLFACYHPASDDSWNMLGTGQTEAEAYEDMIEWHQAWLEDQRDKWETEHGISYD